MTNLREYARNKVRAATPHAHIAFADAGMQRIDTRWSAGAGGIDIDCAGRAAAAIADLRATATRIKQHLVPRDRSGATFATHGDARAAAIHGYYAASSGSSQ